MKKCFLLLFSFCWLIAAAQNKSIIAAKALIKRILPAHYSQVKTKFIKSEKGKDVFEIDHQFNQLIIRGNNAVSIAAGLNWYLKYYCNAQMSWCGNQMGFIRKLPLPKDKFRKVIDQQYRVYMNYCTINYSASWWDWNRWEKEIDFMALNGINMPLSVIGLEAVWYNTLLHFNFSDAEARSFLAGPAFFAWQWMTNLEGHGGPLPYNWIQQRIILGKKIIQRELELGMMPIQQGFTGNVPLLLKDKFPEAKILRQPKWCNFPGAAQLDPLDPLFKSIGRVFLEEEKKLFGANHFYAADPFHESEPPQKDDAYLNKVGTSIIDLMLNFDSASTWVMQAWSIRKQIATAVPKEKLLILDINGQGYKNKDGFWGYPFITGNLHNFGGRLNLHGDLHLVAANQYKKIKENYPTVCGTGLFMESIGQNPVYYDLAFEMGIHSDSVDIEKWLKLYAERRYAHASQNAAAAWNILLKTCYWGGTNGVEKSSIICARPALQVKKSGPNAGFQIPYSNRELVKALTLLLNDEGVLKNADGYRYDIVDLLRQILSNYGQILHANAVESYKKKDIDSFNIYSNRFLSLLKDVDQLLSTRDEFSFKKWITSARSFGKTADEKRLYEYNASMLVTIWGPENDPTIFDYSWREWSGLIKQYYLMRWKEFYAMLADHLKKGTVYDETNLPEVYGRETFRANDFYSRLADMEIAWIKCTKQFSDKPKEESVPVVMELLRKYKNWIEK